MKQKSSLSRQHENGLMKVSKAEDSVGCEVTRVFS